MNRISIVLIASAALALSACAQFGELTEGETAAPSNERAVAAPAAAEGLTYWTSLVPGTDNVYVFRIGNLQSMFVVTSAGVIATDPISYAYPDAATTYLAEIRRITKQPVKYVIYSHHHLDHIAGGKPFKDAGAKFIAHKRAKERLASLKDPRTVMPDETVGHRRVIRLGGTTLELTHVGLNHSDSTLIMRLPKEQVVFAVDFVPVGSISGRAWIDSYPVEWERSLKTVLAMDWKYLIPGHPGLPNGMLGTKVDVRNYLEFMQYASAEVQKVAREGKCWEAAEKQVQLSTYASTRGFEAARPFIVRRYCGLWGRGT